MQFECPHDGRLEILQVMQDFRERKRFCDVTLKSSDGVAFEAHRVILSASSEALAALLGGLFTEGHESTVSVDASCHVLEAVLDYVYRGVAHVQPEHVAKTLSFAHMYGLLHLQNSIVTGLQGQIPVSLALSLLTNHAPMMVGLNQLEAHCFQHLAQSFEETVQSPAFIHLSASQMSHLLKHTLLVVRNEEAVLQAALSWCSAVSGREACFGFILHYIRFPLLSLKSLHALDRHAQTLGPNGIDLQREVMVAITAHRDGDVGDIFVSLNRPCLQHWWSGIGSSVPGGVVVAGGHGAGDDLQSLNNPACIQVRDDAVFIADRGNHRVVRWNVGAHVGQVIAGMGAMINGTNELGHEFFIAVNSDDQSGCCLFVSDNTMDRIVRFSDTSGELLRESQVSNPWDICVTGGTVYALVEEGTRVLKYDSGTKVMLPHHTNGKRLFVTAEGTIYTSEREGHRVQRWLPGAVEGVTVAGGNGPGTSVRQLKEPRGLYVTEDGHVYVCDTGNHRVMCWAPGATAGVIVAGGNGQGQGAHQLDEPFDLGLDSAGTIYIAEYGNHRVTRWGPSPCLQIGGN
eukprot:gnl/MRDRNA2_/MRDRNA2_56644_c0_seq1.p1 gnl/MRDRNA2_/MRDRNA2_56644_c0~~gnl/MRDRNA2_/MRDRNA2_56644_c0_seq1.p1  ORF type:complete len:571 (+),score=54.14 gnl/MRDRNA2_/MRDRNA2_56644_c0_seq1:145-1857(+)